MTTISVSGFAFSAADPFNDGFANAKPGTAQFPTLLSGYAHRPPWKVAGVDYAVGLYSNCTVNTGTSVITSTGSQVDFVNGQQVSLRTTQSGALPSGVSLATAYFVVGVSGRTFQVSLSSGGSAITLGGSPSGVVALHIPVSAAVSMPPGVSYDGASQINCNGNADTTNGSQSLTSPAQMLVLSYDFSFNGGLIVAFGYGGPILFDNCYTQLGSTYIAAYSDQQAGQSTNVVWQWCEIDGNGPNNVTKTQFGGVKYLMYFCPQAGSTMKYCWMHNIPTEGLSPGGNCTIEYCVFNNISYGDNTDHIDTNFPSFTAVISSFVHQFNLIYQPTATTISTWGVPGEADTALGLTLQPNNSQTWSGVVSQNNTVIGLGTSGHMNTAGKTGGPAYNTSWYLDAKGAGTVISGAQIINNYVDSTGIEPAGFIISIDLSGSGTISGTVTTGNISMTTGVTIVPSTAGPQ